MDMFTYMYVLHRVNSPRIIKPSEVTVRFQRMGTLKRAGPDSVKPDINKNKTKQISNFI